jgi:hypothetical protein
VINDPKIKFDLPEESKAKRCGSVKDKKNFLNTCLLSPSAYAWN